MQWLTLVSEDNGVQRLKADNRRPAIARAVDQVSPYPSAHPARIGEHPGTARQRIENRHQDERRKGDDRRRKQVPVILDTRSNHDRRSLQNRRGTHSGDEKSDTPRQRINVYA
jgi:hypothetical protein